MTNQLKPTDLHPALASESWDQMVARHAREMTAKMESVASAAFRKGLEHSPLNRTDPLSMRFVHEMIANKHGLTLEEIRGPIRLRPYCDARHEAWARCQEIGFSLPQIGRFCNGRDHTTVLCGIRRYKEALH